MARHLWPDVQVSATRLFGLKGIHLQAGAPSLHHLSIIFLSHSLAFNHSFNHSFHTFHSMHPFSCLHAPLLALLQPLQHALRLQHLATLQHVGRSVAQAQRSQRPLRGLCQAVELREGEELAPLVELLQEGQVNGSTSRTSSLDVS